MNDTAVISCYIQFAPLVRPKPPTPPPPPVSGVLSMATVLEKEITDTLRRLREARAAKNRADTARLEARLDGLLNRVDRKTDGRPSPGPPR